MQFNKCRRLKCNKSQVHECASQKKQKHAVLCLHFICFGNNCELMKVCLVLNKKMSYILKLCKMIKSIEKNYFYAYNYLFERENQVFTYSSLLKFIFHLCCIRFYYFKRKVIIFQESKRLIGENFQGHVESIQHSQIESFRCYNSFFNLPVFYVKLRKQFYSIETELN